MAAVLAIALKDLKLLFRVRSAWFFTMVWPLIVAVMFGAIFGGGGSGSARLAIAVTDEDQSPASKAFVDGLAAKNGFDVLRAADAEAVGAPRPARRRGARAEGVRRQEPQLVRRLAAARRAADRSVAAGGG